MTTKLSVGKKPKLQIGFLGLGKLGLPVALAIESQGVDVIAYDLNPEVSTFLRDKKIPFKEKDINGLLKNTKIKIDNSVKELVNKSDIIFCAVQTPHHPKFEGDKPVKDEPIDFDYSYLRKAVQEVVTSAEVLNKETTLVVISTCLPGTYNEVIKPLLTPRINYIYNPYFIAMGTVIDDFLHPEFVLIGSENDDTTPLVKFYEKIYGNNDKIFITDITTAEGIKVFYNTFITAKTVMGNIFGEFAHKLGMNVDDIHGALSKATDRLISPKYLKSGVGDGGGCHPRDNIALSYLAKKHDLSFDIFENLIEARERHMAWLASIAKNEVENTKLPLVILGKAFKPETNIQTGSPAILLSNLLKDTGIKFEHWEFDYPAQLPVAVYVVATQHNKYSSLKFPKGSVVIDPFRFIPRQNDVKLVPIGKSNEN